MEKKKQRIEMVDCRKSALRESRSRFRHSSQAGEREKQSNKENKETSASFFCPQERSICRSGECVSVLISQSCLNDEKQGCLKADKNAWVIGVRSVV